MVGGLHAVIAWISPKRALDGKLASRQATSESCFLFTNCCTHGFESAYAKWIRRMGVDQLPASALLHVASFLVNLSQTRPCVKAAAGNRELGSYSRQAVASQSSSSQTFVMFAPARPMLASTFRDSCLTRAYLAHLLLNQLGVHTGQQNAIHPAPERNSPGDEKQGRDFTPTQPHHSKCPMLWPFQTPSPG